MADKTSFTELDSFKLTGVSVTSNELGHGSYATVLELEYMGLKCAGKKIHEVLLSLGTSSHTIKRFEEECRLLSQIRHPNIVQFLGLYLESDEEVPFLVMEFLPTNLTMCIDNHGVLSKGISYSILYDVALGLCYLHGQTPPIIHRDLSSNNVLLTPSMTAKISDLGVARILNLTPLQVSRMTQTPGTPAYMPPEVMVANPKYDTAIDEFSYGILMIHVLSGRWPDPQVGPTRSERKKLIPVSEAERRKIFLEMIGTAHPLMDLILKCIDNDPEQRVHANVIVDETKKMVMQFPITFRSQLQMEKFVQESEENKKALIDVAQMRADLINQKEEEIRKLTKRLQNMLESEKLEKEKLKLAHSLEIKEMEFQVENSKADVRAAKIEKEVVFTENVTLEKKLSEQFERLTANNQDAMIKFETSLTEERERANQVLLEEKERGEKERKAIQELLESKISQLTSENTKLRAKATLEVEDCKSTKLKAEEQVATKDARVKRQIEEIWIKEELVRKKDAAIATISEQILKTREYLATNKQVKCVNANLMFYCTCSQLVRALVLQYYA